MILTQEPGFQLVGEATTGTETLEMLRAGTKADIVLADQNMPGISGIQLAEKVREVDAAVKVIILSTMDREDDVVRAFRAGARSYMFKNIGFEELAFAIKHVQAGNRYLCSELALRFLDRKPALTEIGHAFSGTDLSWREKEVLGMIADGFTNQEIADKLFTSKRTVEGHRLKLLSKTGTRNAASLVRFAVLCGIIA